MTPPALAEGRVCQIPLHPARIVFGSGIGQKDPHLFRRGRQPPQVIRQPTEQRRVIDVPRRSRQPCRLAVGEHEGVDPTPAPLPVTNGGQRRVLKSAERPGLSIASTGGDPLFQSSHLVRGQRLPLRRHAFVGIGMHHPSQHRAGRRLARHDGYPTRFQKNRRTLHRI